MGRPNWHYDHPPACTCAQCAEYRLRKRDRGILSIIKDMIRSLFLRRRG